MRKTKIICTIGPASESEEKLRELMLAGMNVARFNFSHGSHKEQLVKYNRVLKVRKELGLPVATLLDTKGPEIRTGILEGGQKVYLEEGSRFTLTTEQIEGNNTRCSQTYKNLPKDVKVGDTILIDDGLIGLEIEKIEGKDIICRVLNGGELGERKGVNVPYVKVNLPGITEQDKKDIDDTIQNSLLASAEKILESVQDYFNRAEALYSSMYLDCDGETPYLRTVTPIFIDGATPQVRRANEGVDFDGGTPTSRQLAV